MAPVLRLLIIVEHAYRGTVEGQYSHVLWICRSHQRMGGHLGVLLKGNTILYARSSQTDTALTLGEHALTHLNDYGASLAALLTEGATVYVFAPDATRLQMDPTDLVPAIRWVHLADVPDLFAQYDSVWYW